MKERIYSGRILPRCHECGKPILTRRELIYRVIVPNVREVSGLGAMIPTGLRHPFHVVCWERRRQRGLLGKVAAVIVLVVVVVGSALVNLVRAS